MENKAQAEILANMIFSRKKLQIRERGSPGARGSRSISVHGEKISVSETRFP